MHKTQRKRVVNLYLKETNLEKKEIFDETGLLNDLYLVYNKITGSIHKAEEFTSYHESQTTSRPLR